MGPQFSEYFENLNKNILDMLLENGYQMEETDGRGDTALAWAVRNDHYNVAKLLIDKDANVNYKRAGYNLLMRCPNKEEFVNLLLEHGVDVNERNYFGETAVFSAIMSGHWRKAKALIQSRGFNVSIRCNRGRTALDLLNLMYSENLYDLRTHEYGSLEIRQLPLDAAVLGI
jgi:ankyrin repeat protein